MSGWRRVAPALLGLAGAVALAGCNLPGGRSAGQDGKVHYVVGTPYQAGGGWFYPREQFDYNETGLAAMLPRGNGLTADGETADASAMAGAHQTLQLPAIAKVTNLDTGLQVLVRINDRGPPQRGRMVALTPRVFELLGAPGASAMRVRVQVLEAESRRLAASLSGTDEPMPKVAAAPAGSVQAEQLAPPPGVRQSGQGRSAPAGPRLAVNTGGSVAPIPLRLPEQVFRIPPRPGALYVEAATFGGLQYAELMRARLAALGAQTSTSYDAPRDRAYRVRIGPLPSAAVADAMLERAMRAGAPDARIVAE